MKKRDLIWIDVEYLVGANVEYKRKLSFILKVKSIYRNSIVYDYTIKSLAEKIKVSEYTVKKYIPLIEKMGMCRYEGNHLVFNSLNNIFKRKFRRTPLYITKENTINNISDEIDWLILQNQINHQDFVRKQKSDIIKMQVCDYSLSNKEVKKAAKCTELLREGLSERNVMGMRNLAYCIGSSTWKASTLVKKRVEDGFLKTRKLVVRLGTKHNEIQKRDRIKFNLSDIEMDRKYYGYYFNIGNKSYRHMGTEFQLI